MHNGNPQQVHTGHDTSWKGVHYWACNTYIDVHRSCASRCYVQECSDKVIRASGQKCLHSNSISLKLLQREFRKNPWRCLLEWPGRFCNILSNYIKHFGVCLCQSTSPGMRSEFPSSSNTWECKELKTNCLWWNTSVSRYHPPLTFSRVKWKKQIRLAQNISKIAMRSHPAYP